MPLYWLHTHTRYSFEIWRFKPLTILLARFCQTWSETIDRFSHDAANWYQRVSYIKSRLVEKGIKYNTVHLDFFFQNYSENGQLTSIAIGAPHKTKFAFFNHFLAHLSQSLIGELIVYQWSGVRPSVVCLVRPHYETSSSLKPLGRSKPNFMWSLLREKEPNVVPGIWVTWPRWPPRPYILKTFQTSSSPGPVERFQQKLVCSIGDSRLIIVCKNDDPGLTLT